MPIPSKPSIAMVFAESLPIVQAAQLVRPLVVVTKPASPHNFNDFGHNFQADCYLLLQNRAPVELNASVMLFDKAHTEAAISELLAGQPGWIDANQLTIPFCSIMHREEDYRELVFLVGLELAVSVLRRLGDAVILKLEGGDPARVGLIGSDAFYLSMLRQDEAWTAYRRGSRHLRYQPIPNVLDAATSFCMSVDLPSAENAYRVDFDFGSDRLIRDRFAVLIGKNGTGKSQMLLSIIDGLANHPDIRLVPRQKRVRFARKQAGRLRIAPPLFSRLVVFSSTPSDRYPAAIDPWRGIDYQYFSMTQPADSRFDSLTLSIVDCMRDDHRVLFPIPGESLRFGPGGGGRVAVLKFALEPLGLWTLVHLPLKDETGSEPFTDMEWNGRRYTLASRHFNEQRRLLRYRQIDLTAVPVLLDKAGGEPRHLSSGEAAMFRFAAQATAAAETGTIFLFDEPETHLHPHFVSVFAEILHHLLALTNSVAIAATHSAHLVREAPSRRVRAMSIEDRIVTIQPPRLQTFGASIDSISRAVFGDFETQHQYQATLQRWVGTLDAATTIEQVIDEFGGDMNTESLGYVRRLLDAKRDRNGN
ncbi:AAA family ATPase [Rhizobium laguerreae]|uniref:AAA family ATPase n=1 Tax=Rhizobium laguerreae TaxID=1076926 RepID=UPI001C909D9D|nr:AAA family ATPase [Rhizobium laguerreae]MBY3297646.1 AAA family ATPase [Rhizobium laguerreae]